MASFSGTSPRRGPRSAGLSVFVFTGYHLEELTRPEHLALLAGTDVVMACRYVEAERASGLPSRSSVNRGVYLLTDRYGSSAVAGAPLVGIRISPDGGLTLTGFLDDELVRPFPLLASGLSTTDRGGA
jgi:hypothetical protein